MKRIVVGIAVFSFLMPVLALRAEDDDPIKEKLDKAKAVYETDRG